MNKLVELYHISDDIQNSKSFIQNGALPIGKAIGGQTGGFFCFANSHCLNGYIRHKETHLRNFKNDGGLIVNVEVPLDTVKYPNWQFDVANTFCMGDLIVDWDKFIKDMGSFPVQYANGEIKEIVFYGTYYDTEDELYLCFYNKKTKQKFEMSPNGGYGQSSFICQALIDTLCQKSPEFLADYNRCLQHHIKNKGGDAIKYTGHTPLPVSAITQFTVNGRGEMLTNRQIYPNAKFIDKHQNCQNRPQQYQNQHT